MKIFCNYFERKIDEKNCCVDNSEACKTCHYKKNTKVEKNKYRKKSYTPPKSPIKIDKNQRDLLDNIDKYKKSHPLYPHNELLTLIHEIVEKGAKLNIILPLIDFELLDEEAIKKLKPLLSNLEVSLFLYNSGKHTSGDFKLSNFDYTEYNKNIKKLGKVKRATLGTISRLIKLLEPIPTGKISQEYVNIVNTSNKALEKGKKWLIEFKNYLGDVHFGLLIKTYTPGLLDFSIPSSPPNRRQRNISKQFNKKILPIVQELKRIGYSNKTAYKKTALLLNLSYPSYARFDFDTIRSRFNRVKST